MAAGIGACLPPLILLIAGVTVLTTLWKAWDIGTKIKNARFYLDGNP